MDGSGYCEKHTTQPNELACMYVFRDRAGFWEDYPRYPVEDWKHEVKNDDTRLGYWQWVESQIEQQLYEERCYEPSNA